jgi:hypothetical protein
MLDWPRVLPEDGGPRGRIEGSSGRALRGKGGEPGLGMEPHTRVGGIWKGME